MSFWKQQMNLGSGWHHGGLPARQKWNPELFYYFKIIVRKNVWGAQFVEIDECVCICQTPINLYNYKVIFRPQKCFFVFIITLLRFLGRSSLSLASFPQIFLISTRCPRKNARLCLKASRGKKNKIRKFYKICLYIEPGQLFKITRKMEVCCTGSGNFQYHVREYF